MRKKAANSSGVERRKNGQDKPTDTTSPSAGMHLRRTTAGLSHSHTLGLAGSQSSPKPRQSSYRATSNGYHHNGPANIATAPATARKGEQAPKTAWQLRELIRPLPRRCQTARRRSHRLLEHYPAVVEWVHQNRYATNFQIQRQFARYMPAGRTAQYQLASLASLGYLATVPVRSTSPNFPYVYYATGRGVRLVCETYTKLGAECRIAATETAKEGGVALPSVLHELLLTEFDWSVGATVARRADLQRLFLERRYFRRDQQLRFQGPGGTQRVVPDSGFLLRVNSRTSERSGDSDALLLLHLTELDNGTMSVARIKQKLVRYDRWARSDAGQNYLQRLYGKYRGRAASAGFRLLLIAHDTLDATKDRKRLVELLTPALDLPAATRDRLWLTTASELKLAQDSGNLLDSAIWFRGRDMRAWTSECRRLSLHRGAGRQRRFITEHLDRLPQHCLFPHPEHRERP